MIRNAAKRPYTAYLVSILALVLLTALSSLATQFVAWRFDYHPALGWPWIGAIYPPWSCVEWQVRFQAQGPRTFQMLHAGIGLIGAAAAGAALLYASLRGRKAERHEGIHGTAHWATPDEIEATGLLSGKGVYVGGWCDNSGRLRYLRHDGLEHIAAIAPTRAGKGVALVVPTLLS